MSEFRVGDLVKHWEDGSLGIFLGPDPTDTFYKRCLWLFNSQNVTLNLIIAYELSSLLKIKKYKKLKYGVRKGLRFANESGKIDNLTYIELLDKVK